MPTLSTETRRLRTLLLASWALPAAVLASVVAVLGWQVHGLLQLSAWVDHADVVIARVAEAERLLVDGETGLRGFLAYRDERYLEPHDRAAARLDPALETLARSVAHNPEQHAQIEAVRGELVRWRAYAAGALAAGRAGAADPDPAAGKALMDGLRERLRALATEKARVRDARVAEVRRLTLLWILTAAALGLVASLALSLAARRALRDVIHRHEAALRARDEFLVVAGHELRTPLTAVLLELGRLVRVLPAADGGREIAERALRAGERLSDLVVQVLEVPRLVGPIELEREPVDLSDVAREVVRRSERAARAAGAVVSLEAERVIGRWDRRRLALAAASLLSNAIKFGKGTPVRIRVALAGDHAVLEVRDGGDGLGPGELARVFGRFERAVPVHNFGGLGLGLWVTRRVAEAHGGEVRVESTPGAGACFALALPLRAEATPDVGAAPAPHGARG